MLRHGGVNMFDDAPARVVGAVRDAGHGMTAFESHVPPAGIIAVEGHVKLVDEHALHGLAAVFGKEAHGHVVIVVMPGDEHVVLEGFLIFGIRGEHDAALSHDGVASVELFGGHEKMHVETPVGHGQRGRAAGKTRTYNKNLGTIT